MCVCRTAPLPPCASVGAALPSSAFTLLRMFSVVEATSLIPSFGEQGSWSWPILSAVRKHRFFCLCLSHARGWDREQRTSGVHAPGSSQIKARNNEINTTGGADKQHTPGARVHESLCRPAPDRLHATQLVRRIRARFERWQLCLEEIQMLSQMGEVSRDSSEATRRNTVM